MACVLTYVFRYFICHVCFFLQLCLLFIIVYSRYLQMPLPDIVFISTSQLGANGEYLCMQLNEIHFQ